MAESESLAIVVGRNLGGGRVRSRTLALGGMGGGTCEIQLFSDPETAMRHMLELADLPYFRDGREEGSAFAVVPFSIERAKDLFQKTPWITHIRLYGADDEQTLIATRGRSKSNG
jgi:hypothetical protein